MAMTREDIEKLLGPVDDHLVAEIAGIDATAADLAKALAWLEADEALVNDGAHMPIGKVAELIGVLETADEEDLASPMPEGTVDW